MNSDTLKGKWEQLKGDVKTKWGKLTDDDLKTIDGNVDKLLGKLQELYGEARDTLHDKLTALAKGVKHGAEKVSDGVKKGGEAVSDKVKDVRGAV